jgi:hypothetical protein
MSDYLSVVSSLARRIEWLFSAQLPRTHRNVAIGHTHTFGVEPLRVLAFMARDQSTGRGHDTPPRDVAVTARQKVSNSPRCSAMTRFVGDLAVREDGAARDLRQDAANVVFKTQRDAPADLRVDA